MVPCLGAVSWPVRSRGGCDDLAHDPPVLAVLRSWVNPSFSQVDSAPLKRKPAGTDSPVFRVILDGAPAELGDEVERAGERGRGDAPPPMALADETARNPPVGRFRQALLISRPVLDLGHFSGYAELALVDAGIPVEHKCRVHRAGADTSKLPFPKPRSRRAAGDALVTTAPAGQRRRLPQVAVPAALGRVRPRGPRVRGSLP